MYYIKIKDKSDFFLQACMMKAVLSTFVKDLIKKDSCLISMVSAAWINESCSQHYFIWKSNKMLFTLNYTLYFTCSHFQENSVFLMTGKQYSFHINSFVLYISNCRIYLFSMNSKIQRLLWQLLKFKPTS